MGTALAGCRAIYAGPGQFSRREAHGGRFAISRLCRAVVQRGQAVRPIRHRATGRAICCRRRADRQQEYDQIIAPAFLSIGPWFDMCTDPNRLRLEMIDDMISVTGQDLPRPEHQLRPLPRSQVRSDPDRRLLRPGRHLPQHANRRRFQRILARRPRAAAASAGDAGRSRGE